MSRQSGDWQDMNILIVAEKHKYQAEYFLSFS